MMARAVLVRVDPWGLLTVASLVYSDTGIKTSY